MTNDDFDFKEIEKIAKEKEDKDAERIKKIREENLRHIAKITKDLPKLTPTNFKITEEQVRHRDAEAKRFGFVKANKDTDDVLKKKKPIYLQRVSSDEYFAEAVLIDKVPKFLLTNDGTGEISTVDFIPLDKEDRIAEPLGAESYINKPYSFKSQIELNATIQQARTQTLDHLYKMVKRIWKKYVDADDFHISICAADTIFTYFQDKAGMTHYLFFVGGPGSGKSNNLEVFHFLAYRNMTSAGITPATLYRFYGGREEGIGTICEDEANDLDENEDKMRFYKNGYTTGKPIIRNDDTESGRVPQKFFTFGWKTLAAERLPDSIIAKGFMDRTIPMSCTYGFPEYDITEVANPMGEQKFIHLLQELEQVRNLLLVYRMLHYDDKFPDIPLNITGREKQLFKPILRIFNNTETQNALETVISNFVNTRRAANVDSQHAFMFRTVVELINSTGSHELTSKDIWEKVTSMPGEFLYKGNTKFESVDYGLLTQKLVNKICKEVLGAKPDRDKTKRKLVFEKDKLNRLNELFNLSLEVKVTHMTDVTHSGDAMTLMTHSGMAKYVVDDQGSEEIKDNQTYNDNNSNISTSNIENIIEPNDSNTVEHSGKASQASQASPNPVYYKCNKCDYEDPNPSDVADHMDKIHHSKERGEGG